MSARTQPVWGLAAIWLCCPPLSPSEIVSTSPPAACVGTGSQLALLSLSVILLTISGNYFEERGTILTAFIVCYALTSFIGGFFSGGFYARHEGRFWIRAMLLTASLFPGGHSLDPASGFISGTVV